VAAIGSALLQGVSGTSRLNGVGPHTLVINTVLYNTNVTIAGNTIQFSSTGQEVFSVSVQTTGSGGNAPFVLQIFNNTTGTVDASYTVNAYGGNTGAGLQTVQLVLDVADISHTFSLRVFLLNNQAFSPILEFIGPQFSCIITPLASAGSSGVSGSGTAPLFAKWSASTVLTSVGVAPVTADPTADGIIAASTSAKKPLVLQTAASPAANAMEVQASNGFSYFAVPCISAVLAGANNLMIGSGSIPLLSGSGNVRVGDNSCPTLTTGADNVVIGHASDVNLAGCNGAVIIGKATKGTTGSVVLGAGYSTSVVNDLIVSSPDTGIYRSAAGVLRIIDGSLLGIGALLSKLVVTAKVADYVITNNESLSVFTNSAAPAAVTFTLPTAPVAGLVYIFQVSTAQNLIVNTGTTVLIYVGTAVSTATTGAFTSNAVGSCLMLIFNGTFWAGFQSGNWSPS
jgi:hypothetical protein